MLRQSAVLCIRKKGSTVAPNVPIERFSQRWVEKGKPTRGRYKDPEYRAAYVIQSFIKDKHVHDIQSIDFGGMYKEELSIERARHPNTCKSLVIGTNGAMNEREFEYLVPPIVTLYNDRSFAHRSRVVQLAKVGKLKSRGSWTHTNAPEVPDLDTCNALEFPYCVPRKIPLRNPVSDPLNSLATKFVMPEEEDPLHSSKQPKV